MTKCEEVIYAHTALKWAGYIILPFGVAHNHLAGPLQGQEHHLGLQNLGTLPQNSKFWKLG